MATLEEVARDMQEKRRALGLSDKPASTRSRTSSSDHRSVAEIARAAAEKNGLTDAEAAAEAERLDRQEKVLAKERADALWAASGVPARHAEFFPEAVVGPWGEAYVRLLAALGEGFISAALGSRGVGKTQLGVCLVRSSCTLGRPAKYTKAVDIFMALREAYRKDGVTEAEVVRRYVQPDLLIIDAMEVRGETAFEDRLLDHIIDKRYDDKSDTLLITNQTPEAFKTSAGPSIVSRILETGGLIECKWPSFRSPK